MSVVRFRVRFPRKHTIFRKLWRCWYESGQWLDQWSTHRWNKFTDHRHWHSASVLLSPLSFKVHWKKFEKGDYYGSLGNRKHKLSLDNKYKVTKVMVTILTQHLMVLLKRILPWSSVFQSTLKEVWKGMVPWYRKHKLSLANKYKVTEVKVRTLECRQAGFALDRHKLRFFNSGHQAQLHVSVTMTLSFLKFHLRDCRTWEV